MGPESSSPRVQEPATYMPVYFIEPTTYEGWNFNSGNYLFTTDTK